MFKEGTEDRKKILEEMDKRRSRIAAGLLTTEHENMSFYMETGDSDIAYRLTCELGTFAPGYAAKIAQELRDILSGYYDAKLKKVVPDSVRVSVIRELRSLRNMDLILMLPGFWQNLSMAEWMRVQCTFKAEPWTDTESAITYIPLLWPEYRTMLFRGVSRSDGRSLLSEVYDFFCGERVDKDAEKILTYATIDTAKLADVSYSLPSHCVAAITSDLWVKTDRRTYLRFFKNREMLDLDETFDIVSAISWNPQWYMYTHNVAGLIDSVTADIGGYKADKEKSRFIVNAVFKEQIEENKLIMSF